MILAFVSPIIVRKYDYNTDESHVICNAAKYLDVVNSAIIQEMLKNQDDEWIERGIIAYADNPLIQKCVSTARLYAEVIDNKLMAITQCVLKDEYLPFPIKSDEFNKLVDDIKDEITGQFSDGWGEGVEQREIYADGEEIYISFWNFDDWEIKLRTPVRSTEDVLNDVTNLLDKINKLLDDSERFTNNES